MESAALPVPDVSFVIPVYNEEENLPILADEIDRAMAGFLALIGARLIYDALETR